MDQFKHFLLTISNGPSSGNQLCSLIFTKHYQSLIVRFHTTTYSGASLRQRACRGAQLQGHPHLWGNHRWGCHQVSPTFSYIWSFGGKVASYFENCLHSKLPIPHWFPLFVWLIRLSLFVWLRAPAPVPVQTSQPRHANGRHWPDFYSRSLAPLVLPNILKPAIVLPIKMTMSSILAPIDNPSYIATHWILDQLPVIAQEVVYHEWLCRNGQILKSWKRWPSVVGNIWTLWVRASVPLEVLPACLTRPKDQVLVQTRLEHIQPSFFCISDRSNISPLKFWQYFTK